MSLRSSFNCVVAVKKNLSLLGFNIYKGNHGKFLVAKYKIYQKMIQQLIMTLFYFFLYFSKVADKKVVCRKWNFMQNIKRNKKFPTEFCSVSGIIRKLIASCSHSCSR